MRTETTNPSEEPAKKSAKLKILKWSLITIISLLLIIFFTIPAYLSSDSAKDFLIGKVNDSLNGQVQVSSFSMGWFKGISLKDFTFADDKGETSIQAREIATRPCYGSLLLGRVALGKTLIDQPNVMINIPDLGLDAKLKSKTTPADPKVDSGLPPVAFALDRIDLTVRNGNVKIKSDSKGIGQLEFRNIESKVDLKGTADKSSFDLSMQVAGPDQLSQINAKGSLTPGKEKGWTLKGTSGDVTIKIDELDLESLQPLLVLLGKDDIKVCGKISADIDAKVDNGKPTKIDARAYLFDFSQQIGDKRTVLSEPVKLTAKISSKNDTVKIDQLEFKSSFLDITCTGGTNSLQYTATSDLADFQEALGPFGQLDGYTFAGFVTEKGTVSFNKDSISAIGTASFERFEVTNPKGKKTPSASIKLPFDMQWDTQDNAIRIASLKAESTFGSIELADSTIPFTDDEKLKLKILTNADLAKLKPFIDTFVDTKEPTDIAGKLTSELNITKPKKAFRFLTNKTQIKNLHLAVEGKKPLEDPLVKAELDMLVDFDEKTYEIKNIRLDASQIDLEGNFSYSTSKNQTELSGKVELDYDIEQIAILASDVFPKDLTITGKRKDTIKIASRYPTGNPDKLLTNMNTDIQFGFDTAEYKGLLFAAAETNINISNGILTIAPFSAEVNGGKINLAGAINLNEEHKTLTIPGPLQIVENVNINEKIGKELLMYLNPLFADQGDIKGIADFRADKLSIPLGSSDNKQLIIDGTIAISDMDLKAKGLLGQILSQANTRGDITATMLPTRFILENEMLSYDDMQINLDVYPTTFAGRIGLDKYMDMRVKLPYKIDRERLKLRTVKVGEDLTGRLELPIQGTVDNPQIRLEGLLENLGKEFIEKEALKFLEKLF